MNVFPNESYPHWRSHLVRPPILLRCRTFSSRWYLFVFIMKFWLSWKFFPMNVAAFIVAAINIPQIIECSSPDPATFDILFCLFRTWSFTLFTNSAASLPMTKFTESATSWEVDFIRLPWLITKHPSVPYGLRISVEKSISMMRTNLLDHTPRSLYQVALIDRAP